MALPGSRSGAVSAQSIQIVNDHSVPITTTQTVNVGEHVHLWLRVTPASTAFTKPTWTVSGTHLKDWLTKDAEPVKMSAADYRGGAIHVLWKNTTLPFLPNTVRVQAVVNGTTLTSSARFRVVRAPKPEKYYSDDLLMENHNNWHSVYMFAVTPMRRGDLFLAWHRSQLEYFNSWRKYFGYGPIKSWTPTTAWSTTTGPVERRHPSNPPPVPAFSQRHDLTTLDLTDQQLATPTEGQFDWVTQAQGLGTNSQFVNAGFILTLDAVAQVAGLEPGEPGFTRTGPATMPTWWAPNTGQTARDPWYQFGCPALATPVSDTWTSSCSVTSKRSFDNYTLRELGESIESGIYDVNFQFNYHALGHMATSTDMSNPATSMRDPVFWGWHYWIDSILTSWQATRGVEAKPPLTTYQTPKWSADWTAVDVPFTHRVIAEFVRPANLLVNGSPATTVTDVSLNGTGYIFRFSGFPTPPAGPVVVTLRREINNTIRTNLNDGRPMPTLIVSTFGNPLQPAVRRFTYTRP